MCLRVVLGFLGSKDDCRLTVDHGIWRMCIHDEQDGHRNINRHLRLAVVALGMQKEVRLDNA